ncbi:RagB/SusD family nutrient uptake outer membrane protein [Sphingobacterium sp. SYP-B4668]|uniref:RagB/SusD family nutrient uptake outer membrane protein n=1 Tax=Sphingobacterium sp. SYP-B4668 TaxID=2996035 RepID=UPI0005326BEC|nr:RagB/SusD family nutrient uptake outer membrane protein [Sphingobacterium sp. SYP-B4668]
MKKYSIYLITITVMLLGTSCNDFLLPEPTDRYSENVAFSSETNAKLYVNSFYPILNHYGLFGSAYIGGNMYTDGLTDIMKTAGSTIGSNGASANIYATNPSLITPDQNSLDIWSNAYYYIRLINEFLTGLEKSSLPATAKTNLSAEARFFRGYLYFLLMRNHGSVIALTELTTTPNNPRTTEAEGWDVVQADLDYAAKNLQAVATDVGRITKGAAYAMQSRAMLYAQRWQAAYDAAVEVEELDTYSLNPAYQSAFGSYFNGNKEAILEFRYSFPQLTHSFDAIVSPGGDDNLYQFGGDVQPTQELVELYEKAGGGKVNWDAWHGDIIASTPPWATLEPRFHATVLYNGATWKGRTIETFVNGRDGWTAYPPAGGSNRGASVTGYFLRKNLDEGHADLVNIASAQTLVEIRLAEVYLNFAEAAYHLDKITDANKALKEVRGRVGLPELNLSGASLLAQIKKERTIELAGEGQHYWDLRRWKDAESTLTGKYVHGIKITGEANSFRYTYIRCDDTPRQFPAKLYSFPIQSSELINNPACKQIQGW